MVTRADEERRLAREWAAEFDHSGRPEKQAFWSNSNDDFLIQVRVLAGDSSQGSYLRPGEREHLIALFYNLRCYASHSTPERVREEMGCVYRSLVARGLNAKAAYLMMERAAWERQTNLISLADQVATISELEVRS